ncbi:MAG: aminotransferase class III-fold pyridoxal phosphate-dependent enzyme, partial [Candidatus Omnitrophica bacterium]|nr:aminotransferase class III-fold pyridoxal phosphate-dependent enzyme [Candidatus Omnitrophota bacterium]
VQELHTFASPTLSHVTSLKMLEIIARDAILERTREMGEYLRGRLEALKEDFPEIADVRQVGLHIGVEFARPDRDLTPLPNEVKRIRAEAMKRGCIFGLGGVRPWVLKVKPPLIISEEEADKVIAILCEAMTAVFGRSKVAVS